MSFSRKCSYSLNYPRPFNTSITPGMEPLPLRRPGSAHDGYRRSAPTKSHGRPASAKKQVLSAGALPTHKMFTGWLLRFPYNI